MDISDKAKEALEKGKDMAENAADKAKDLGHDALDKAKDLGHKAGDVAHDALEKAKEIGGNVVDKVKDSTKEGGLLDKLKDKRKKLEESEQMVTVIQKWPRPGTLGWEQEATADFNRLECQMEAQKGNVKVTLSVQSSSKVH